MAFNPTRATASITGAQLTKATTATIRRTLINIATPIATPARRGRIHLPASGPREHT